jgi:hypothetical protein
MSDVKWINLAKLFICFGLEGETERVDDKIENFHFPLDPYKLNI